jgi:hypothetical protein
MGPGDKILQQNCEEARGTASSFFSALGACRVRGAVQQ